MGVFNRARYSANGTVRIFIQDLFGSLCLFFYNYDRLYLLDL